VSASAPEFALPSGEIQSALNGAFLNLNRSGLAINKLFHFIDRIPTMQTMDKVAVESLSDALNEAGNVIAKLQSENAKLKADLKKSRMEVDRLERDWAILCEEKQDLEQEIEVVRSANFRVTKPAAKREPKKSQPQTRVADSNTFLLPEGATDPKGLKRIN
jgi:chromosome segregation ATPase